jgi:geranylgeranyl diphosphate synthase type II
MAETLAEFLERCRARIDRELELRLPPATDYPPKLHEALRYTILLGGKRLRPILSLTVGSMFGSEEAEVMPAACAIEMVHASSLILDDLPCMDDASLRRGRPACHRVYGEATAILAAVALLNRAFGVIAAEADASRQGDRLARRIAGRLAAAIGPVGILSGQHIDLESTGRRIDFETLEYIHSHKTGALFTCAAEIGALIGGAPLADMAAITTFAKNLGLAFQVTDDLLDAAGSPDVTGKDAGLDRDKTTFVSFAGEAGARRLVDDLIAASTTALAPFRDRASRLVELAELVRTRDR